MAVAALISVASRFGYGETAERLKAAIANHGAEIFAEIDHAKGAAEAGLSLRPTLLLIFGNPRGGTPLMQADQTIGFDLPLKALVWQDQDGAVWATYEPPRTIVERYGLDPQMEPVQKLSAFIERVLAEIR